MEIPVFAGISMNVTESSSLWLSHGEVAARSADGGL